MSKKAFSLIEALIAAAIVAVGLTAAASLVGALMAREEANTVALRAANIQEQAVTLYRLGLSEAKIRELLPENCTGSTAPGAGSFGLTFGSPAVVACAASDGAAFNAIGTSCNLIYPITSPDGTVLSYRSNSVTIVQPSTLWPVP